MVTVLCIVRWWHKMAPGARRPWRFAVPLPERLYPRRVHAKALARMQHKTMPGDIPYRHTNAGAVVSCANTRANCAQPIHSWYHGPGALRVQDDFVGEMELLFPALRRERRAAVRRWCAIALAKYSSGCWCACWFSVPTIARSATLRHGRRAATAVCDRLQVQGGCVGCMLALVRDWRQIAAAYRDASPLWSRKAVPRGQQRFAPPRVRDKAMPGTRFKEAYAHTSTRTCTGVNSSGDGECQGRGGGAEGGSICGAHGYGRGTGRAAADPGRSAD